MHDAKQLRNGAMLGQEFLRADNKMAKHDVVLCKCSRSFCEMYGTGISHVIGKS